MKIGIVGLQQSGKTSIFNALTGSHAVTGEYYHKDSEIQPNMSVVKIPDKRLDDIYDLLKPPRKVNATIEYIDVAGFTKSSDKKDIKSREYLGHISNADVLMVVIRKFEDEKVIHPEDSINPLRDLEIFNTEILFRDMEVVENRLERLKKSFTKRDNIEEKREIEILEQCQKALESEKPLSEVEFSDEQEKMIRGFQFLTHKPLLIVLNVSEEEIGAEDKVPEFFKEYIARDNVRGMSICGKIEMELSELEQTDAKEFMRDYGIDELATNKIINICYDLMRLISFFTTGDKEVRAWSIKSGTKAKQAAGVVHTDMEKGFIKAEVISVDELLENKSIQICKEKGIMRLEGKDYVVKDGDIIFFRFNV